MIITARANKVALTREIQIDRRNRFIIIIIFRFELKSDILNLVLKILMIKMSWIRYTGMDPEYWFRGKALIFLLLKRSTIGTTFKLRCRQNYTDLDPQ
jgi:hypothetical protein